MADACISFIDVGEFARKDSIVAFDRNDLTLGTFEDFKNHPFLDYGRSRL